MIEARKREVNLEKIMYVIRIESKAALDVDVQINNKESRVISFLSKVFSLAE